MKHIHAKTKAASKDVATTVTAAITKIHDAVGAIPGTATLTSTERHRTLKPRTGAEKHIRQIAKLAIENGKLRPSNVDPHVMTERLDIAEELAPLRAALESSLQRIDDTILFAESHAYHDALDILAVARSFARQDHTLAAQIAPFDDFLRLGARAHHDAPVANTTPAHDVTTTR